MKDNKEKSINKSIGNPNIGYQMYKDSKKKILQQMYINKQKKENIRI